MADLPTGAKFGTLVHAVLETADPFAADLAAELETQIREHSVWWPVDVAAGELAAAMVPMHDTPLGPAGRRHDAAPDRAAGSVAGDGLRIPVGRWRSARVQRPRSGWRDVGELLREHLPADDPLASYADRLTGAALGGQSLRGYLTGSVDAVLRIRGTRYLGGRLQDQLARRSGAAVDRRRLRRGRDWSRRCCTRTIRCRRCCTALCCTGSCGGGCPATTRARIWAACCICSCAACAGRTPRWSTGIPPGCSAGSRRRR